MLRPSGGTPFSVSILGRRFGGIRCSRIRSSRLFTSSDTGSRSRTAAPGLPTAKDSSRLKNRVRTMFAVM